MQTITYFLQNPHGKRFYNELSLFTDKLLAETNVYLQKDIKDFEKFYNNEIVEKPRATNEYIVEYIALGMFVEKYAAFALNTGKWTTSSMEALYNLRKKSQSLKPFVDNVRGVLSAHLLYKKNDLKFQFNKELIFKLLNWMKASGEFKEETERLSQWAYYISSLNIADAEAFLSRSTSFARYFEEQGKIHLGDFTLGVAAFLENEYKQYKYREDFLFCGRSEAEYHLNMFGAEVLNRVLKANFDQTKHKVLLLPTCMSQPENGKCKAVLNNNRMVCSGCSANCRVNQLRKEMLAEGEETFLIPHSSSFSEFLKYWQNQNETGLIGVACVLNLLTGGYEMQRLNIPSQCVFLDYSGCKKHWHATGIPTNIDTEQLKNILIPSKTATLTTNV